MDGFPLFPLISLQRCSTVGRKGCCEVPTMTAAASLPQCKRIQDNCCFLLGQGTNLMVLPNQKILCQQHWSTLVKWTLGWGITTILKEDANCSAFSDRFSKEGYLKMCWLHVIISKDFCIIKLLPQRSLCLSLDYFLTPPSHPTQLVLKGQANCRMSIDGIFSQVLRY